MRLCSSVSLCLAAAALLLPTAPAYAQAEPACAVPGERDFPLSTRIRGGPDSYEAGGGYGVWYLDLTNTTDRTCENIHPVVVLVDGERQLKPSQPRLEFYAGPRAHPVRFETTDEDELVGAFDDGFPGFTVRPGRTVTVKVRLAVTSDAAPNQVTANAAVVQRHDDDGDWVGQSNDYRFGIDADPEPSPRPQPEPSSTAADGRHSLADELARTGLGPAGGALAGAALLLAAAGGALLLVRRRR
jgi:hypothetical protein